MYAVPQDTKKEIVILALNNAGKVGWPTSSIRLAPKIRSFNDNLLVSIEKRSRDIRNHDSHACYQSFGHYQKEADAGGVYLPKFSNFLMLLWLE
jgi:hypothetical protein